MGMFCSTGFFLVIIIPPPLSTHEKSKRNDPTMSSMNVDSFSDNTSLNGEFFRTLQSKYLCEVNECILMKFLLWWLPIGNLGVHKKSY